MTTNNTTSAAPRRPKPAVDVVDPSTGSAAAIVAAGGFSLEWLSAQAPHCWRSAWL